MSDYLTERARDSLRIAVSDLEYAAREESASMQIKEAYKRAKEAMMWAEDAPRTDENW